MLEIRDEPLRHARERVPEWRIDRGGAGGVAPLEHDLDVFPEIADRVAQHLANALTVVARERADVDIDLRAVGDHVHLHAAVRDIR